jgi:WD40 repeat protein
MSKSQYRLKETACVRVGGGTVWSARWRPQGDVFAACGQDKRLRLFDGTNLCLQEENGNDRVHSRSLRRVTWRGDGQLLAVACFDAKVSLWTYGKHLEMTTILVGHESEVKSVAFSPDGDLLASCSRDKSIFLFDVSGDLSSTDCVGVLQGHNQDVKNIVFSPDGEFLASSSYDDSVKIWKQEVDEDDWHIEATLKGHSSTVLAAAVDAESNHLVTVSADATIKIWQVPQVAGETTSIPSWLISPILKSAFRQTDTGGSWKLLTTVQGTGAVLDVAWQGHLLATVSSDNFLRIFETSTPSRPELVASFEFSSEPNSVQFRPGGHEELLVALDDGTVRRLRLLD